MSTGADLHARPSSAPTPRTTSPCSSCRTPAGCRPSPPDTDGSRRSATRSPRSATPAAAPPRSRPPPGRRGRDRTRTSPRSSEPGHAGEKLSGLIKISSDVISGDSGGATYDDEGEVIGMTTAASTGTSDVVGYAIPIAQVLQIAGDLENGIAERPLRVRLARLPRARPRQGSGTTVAGVYPGTPAARAGSPPATRSPGSAAPR